MDDNLYKFYIPYVILAVVVGGIDMMTQALTLAKKPHVVIGIKSNRIINIV